MSKSYEDSFSDVHLKPTSHLCRSDGVCKCEQPTQEPVLYIDGGGLDGHATWAQATRCQDTDIALYTHPKEWQGLSDDELEELSSEEELMFWGFARAIEAKLKEKNNA